MEEQLQTWVQAHVYIFFVSIQVGTFQRKILFSCIVL